MCLWRVATVSPIKVDAGKQKIRAETRKLTKQVEKRARCLGKYTSRSTKKTGNNPGMAHTLVRKLTEKRIQASTKISFMKLVIRNEKSS